MTGMGVSMLSYGLLLMYYLIQANTLCESNLCFSKLSLETSRNDQAFGEFSAYFVQRPGKL